jgi:chemotaxis receptor (MCP) glutamine deamidase CheD
MSEISVRLLQCKVAGTGFLKIDRIGSGVGVILYSPANRVGAALHILAPRSGNMAPKNPVMYADTAIPYALQLLEAEGVNPPLSVAIAGGGVMLGREAATGLGQKVVDAVKEALADARLSLKRESTGGSEVRSMVLDIEGAKIKIN